MDLREEELLFSLYNSIFAVERAVAHGLGGVARFDVAAVIEVGDGARNL